jgi:hypothetical protein
MLRCCVTVTTPGRPIGKFVVVVQQWHDRAAVMRALTETITDVETRAIMLRLASGSFTLRVGMTATPPPGRQTMPLIGDDVDRTPSRAPIGSRRYAFPAAAIPTASAWAGRGWAASGI